MSQGLKLPREETPAAAQNSDALRKAAQNPVASLISVPIQENWNFGIGPSDRIQNVMNVQPVIPVNVGQNWNLIIRWITPVIYQPIGAQTGFYGLGDMQPAFFLSPKKGKLIWGVGPQLLLPTATKTGILGQGKFGLGPTFVALVRRANGQLAFWQITSGRSPVNPVCQTSTSSCCNTHQLQPEEGLVSHLAAHHHRQLEREQRQCVDGAVGGGIGRIMKLGFQPVNVGLQLWQRRPSSWGFALGHAGTDCVAVSQINQAATKDDDGTETETDGAGAAAEVIE